MTISRTKLILKTILPYARISMSCAIVIYLLSLVDLDRLIYIFSKLQFRYIWQPFILVLLTYLSVAIRWSLLLKHFEIRQSVRDSWHYYMVSLFYSTVLPGVIGADIVRLGLSLKFHFKSKIILASSIVFERTCGIVVIFLMASLSTLFIPMLVEEEHQLADIVTWIAISILFFFLLFFIILKVSPSSLIKKPAHMGNWKSQALTLLYYFRNLPFRMLLLFLFLSVIAHLFDITACYFLSLALHINQPYVIFLWIIPLVYVLTMLPISIGGLGVREGVLTFFLVKLGVVASDAVLLAFLIYLNKALAGSVGGVLQFIKNK